MGYKICSYLGFPLQFIENLFCTQLYYIEISKVVMITLMYLFHDVEFEFKNDIRNANLEKIFHRFLRFNQIHYK